MKTSLYFADEKIRHLARVPLNTVDTREFWVRSPRRTFHFFLIDKDSILELQADGSVMTGAGYLPELPMPTVPAVLPAGTDPATEQAPEKG